MSTAVLSVQRQTAGGKFGPYLRVECDDADLHAALDALIADPSSYELVHKHTGIVGSKKTRIAKAMAAADRGADDEQVPGT